MTDNCEHNNRKLMKRARESHEMGPWDGKIIEKCRDCGEYILT